MVVLHAALWWLLEAPFLPLQLLDCFHGQAFIWGDAKLANLLVDGRGLNAKVTAVDVGSGRYLNAPSEHSARLQGMLLTGSSCALKVAIMSCSPGSALVTVKRKNTQPGMGLRPDLVNAVVASIDMQSGQLCRHWN